MNYYLTTTEQPLTCDVLVIGAGPGGSTAARVAAQEGARVLLVERKPRVGVPEQCAGYVAQAIRRHVDLPGECVAQAVGRLRTWLPDGTAHEAEMPGYLLNRAALDRHLACQAVKAGVRLLLRTAAVRMMPQGDDAGAGPVQVVLRSQGQEVPVEAAVVIGADGPQSTVARWTGQTPGPLAAAVQYEVVLQRRLRDAEVYFRPAFRGGYAWLFPAGETARVGASFDPGNTHGMDGLRRLMAELQQERRITDSAISYTVGRVPAGGPCRVRRDNVLLVGDAASHTHAITGAGILNAIIAGEMAGRASARAALSRDMLILDEYDEEFETVLGPALERAQTKRAGLDRAWGLPSGDLSRTIRESWIAFDEYYAR